MHADAAPAQTETTETTDGDPVGPSTGRRRRRPRPAFVLLGLVVVLGLLAAGAGLRSLTDSHPGADSVDAGFAWDMTVHHGQAVEMALIEYRAGGYPALRAVAKDMALGQEREMGIMSDWLTTWGLPQAPPANHITMGWMPASDAGGEGHGSMGSMGSMSMGPAGTVGADGLMPGMATPAQMTTMAATSGRALDLMFLSMMIWHHEGGLAMAQEAAAHATDSRVRSLAKAMVINQSNEIQEMHLYQRQFGVTPT